jgi:acetolactate synthase-1/2/3 large subunit
VGRPGVVALRAPNFAIQNCDLLIAIGSRLDNIITAYNPRGFASAARKIVIDVDRNEIDKLDMEIELRVESDAAVFLRAVKEQAVAIPQLNISAWRQRCCDWKNRYTIANEMAFPARGEINHFQAMDALSDAISEASLRCTR